MVEEPPSPEQICAAAEEVRTAKQAVEKYHDLLNRAKFDIETQRDKTLVLITGGALTVSFAFVPALLDKGLVLALSMLIVAWCLWVGTLVLTLMNYTLSVHMYSAVLEALSTDDYDRVSRGHWAQKWVEKLNVASIVLMVLGFCAFGRFAIVNLERGAYVAKVQETTSQETRREALHSHPPGATAGVPALAGKKEGHAQEKVSQ